MSVDQTAYLREHYQAKEWLKRSKAAAQMVKNFRIENVVIEGWILHHHRTDRVGAANAIHSIWRREDSDEKLLSIDVYECASAKEAHEMLLELLGTFQTDAMRRHTGEGAIGDVFFTFNHATALFSRANAVVLIRNAGREIVPVEPIARKLEAIVSRG